MKLNNKHIIYSIFSIMLLATSCKKLVDIDEPIDTVTSVKIFTTDTQADQTLAGLYAQMVGNRTQQLTFGYATIYGGLAADELIINNTVAIPDEVEFYTNNILPANELSEQALWSKTYQTLYTANAILDGEKASTSTQLTITKRNELKGSAKFIRAFCLFYLTNFYGEIPLPLNSNYFDIITLNKATQNQVYEQIITDLNESIEHFKNTSILATAKTKANQYIAEALLARVYLYTKNWALAATHAGNIINSGKFNLSTLENAFTKNSTEAIFQLGISDPDTHVLEMIHLAPMLPLYMLPPADQVAFLDPSMYEMVEPALKPNYILSDNLVNAFETGDRRITIWANFNGSPSVAPYFGKKTYFSNKYPMDGIFKAGYMVIRLGEIYLIRAEALAMENNLSLAMEDINKIRNRAGLGKSNVTDKGDVLKAIAKERQTELFTEWGHRFFDLKRTENALTVLAAIPEKKEINANKLVFPIPANEIVKNPKIKQNPGY